MRIFSFFCTFLFDSRPHAAVLSVAVSASDNQPGNGAVVQGRDPFSLHYVLHGSGPEKVLLVMGASVSAPSLRFVLRQ
jgi:hypothetical protein